MAWRVFLLLLCLLLYLWLIGVPGFLVNRWLKQIDSRPFRLGLARLNFDPTVGVVASGVYLYHLDDFSEPLARVQRVVLKPDWSALKERRFALRALVLHQGSLHLPAPIRTNAPTLRLAARAIEGRIELRSDRVELAPLRLHLFGVNWETTGSVLRAGATMTTSGGFWEELSAVLEAMSAAPPATDNVLEELNALRFDPPAKAQVALQFDPSRPQGWDIQVQIQGGQAVVRGATFDALQAKVHIVGPLIDVERIALGSKGQRCTLTGQLDLDSRVASARLYSDLPPAPWIAVMPRSWQDELRAADLTAEGSMRSEVWLGPAPLDELARTLHGWLSVEGGRVRGIPFEKAYCAIQVTGESISFDHLSAVVGQAAGRGPLEGEVIWHRDLHEVTGQLRLNFDPNLALSVLSSNQARLVRRFTFPAEPPQFSGHFRHVGGTTPTTTLAGHLAAGTCTYRDVALTSVVATLQYSNHVLTLSPFHFSRPEGTVGGGLRLDLEEALYAVDLEGNMDPHAVAGLVGPGLSKVLSITHYEHAVEMSAHGVVDGRRGDHRTLLMVGVKGQRMGLTNWLADTVQLNLEARGETYTTTNATGTAYGGAFQVAVKVTPDATTTSHLVHVSAVLTNAELARLAAQLRTNALADSQGRVSLWIEADGPVRDPDRTRLTATGSVQVVGGEIMRQPLFGGLSRLLSVIYPGLGFTAQNDLQADFVVRNGKIISKNARLEGSVVSMKAGGYYAFDGKVRFNVEVQLLRKGPLASVLRFVTMPVTKLLVFQLSGTLQDPHWRPVNLPKELFLIFE